MNCLTEELNRVKYSENLSHVNQIDRTNFTDDPYKYLITMCDGTVKLNGVACGIYNFNNDNLRIEGTITEGRIERIIEMATSCQHSEFKSSSPSMILHQISVMTFLDIMPGNKSIEEFTNNRRNDLIWMHDNRNIIVEVTGRKYLSRYKSLDQSLKKDILIINKYIFNPLTRDVDNIRSLSLDNDKQSIESMYRMIIKQSQSVQKEMLYGRNLLKFFINIPKIHIKACEDAHLEYTRESVSSIPESKDPEISYVRKCVEDLSEGLDKLKTREMGDTDFYSIDLNVLRGFDYELELEKESIDSKLGTHATCEDGNLEFPRAVNIDPTYKLYSYQSTCALSDKAYMAALDYPKLKLTRENYVIEHLAEIIDRFSTISNLYELLNRLSLRRFGLSLSDYRPKKRRIQARIRPQTLAKTKHKVLGMEMMCLSTYGITMDRDPDHVSTLKSCNVQNYIIDIMCDSRDVFELRLKKRIALSALKVKRSMKPFRVYHWKNKSIYCDCIIMGKLFQKDSGVMYVSYYTDYQLTKTQKWRLPDIENYSVGPERALALTAAIGNRNLTYMSSKRILTLYYRLLNENSWGISKFLKPYRYFSSGIAMGSSRTHDQIPKLIDIADSYIIDKLSIRYLIYLLKTSEMLPGRTPAFDLDFEDIGYECFIINLCPSKTYGSSRHLVKVLTELSDEIKLYNQNFEITKSIFDDFESIISTRSRDRDFLKQQYLDHLKLIDKCSLLNNGRFTFSPSALLMCKRELDGLTLRPELSRPPSIDELATARGSTSNFNNEPRMALESINELSRRMNTSSTTRLAIRLLNSQPVDLTMRMFDKDQVGGDREISILNAGFRILQSVSESFFKSLGSQSGVDLLADKHKVLNYTKSISECLESKISRLLTIDQTRWGPNFNTLTFGLLALMTSHLSTEYFIPAIVCFMSEFKVFEMPILEPELSGNQELSYSLPGLVGRSHMGQGIFHYASSFYHSLCLLSIKRLYYKTFQLRPSQCVIRTFCTSDDASIVAYSSTSCRTSDLEIVSDKIKYLYGFFERIIHLYGIKTNKTKNIDSFSTIEFNSMYYSRSGIGSNDIKFLYSLIDPTTTGNIYRDSNMIYMVFDRAINSGCTIDNATIISKCLYLIKIRQWGARGHIVKPPSYDLICTGCDILEPHDPAIPDSLFFTTGLRFTRKRRILEQYLMTDNVYVLTRIKQESNFESMINSKISEKYRSMQTYNKINKVAVPISSIFRSLAPTAITMSNEFFLREFFSSAQVIKLLKGRDQKISNTLYQKCWTKPSLFTFKMLKQRRLHDFDPMAYLISLQDPITSLRNLDDQDEFILHLYRHKTRYYLNDETINEYSGMTVSDKINKLTKLRIELEMSSPNVVQMVFNPGAKAIEYTRQVRNWDRSAAMLSRIISLNCVSNLSKVKHSVCYTNTESVTAYYSRYYPTSGDFRDFIPSSLSEWPQVSMRQSSIKLSDVNISEKVLKILCERENSIRESRSETPYLVMRRRIDNCSLDNDSCSQFTFDFSEGLIDNFRDDYCYIEIPQHYSYLATSYVLKQALLISLIKTIGEMGGCIYKDIESVISGTHTITYFSRGMIREIEWLVTEKMTSMSSDKQNQEMARNFLFDAYYNIFELDNQDYFPIYAMLSVTRPHYISFKPRGRRVERDVLKERIYELVNHDSVINEQSEILKMEYLEREIESDSDKTITSYEREDFEDDMSLNSSDTNYEGLLQGFETLIDGLKDEKPRTVGINDDFRNDLEEVMNLINMRDDDSSSEYSVFDSD